MAQQFVAADIRVDLMDRNGRVIEMPKFARPTDEEWASNPDAAVELNSEAENREINWMEDNRIGSRWTCTADQTVVTIRVVGTSETASCGRDHRWMRTFGENDGWRQLA